jgi:hypothetical protein
MPGEGGVFGVVDAAVLEAVVLAGVVLAVVLEAGIAGLLCVAGAGGVAGFGAMVVIAGFEVVGVVAGFAPVVAVLLVVVDLPEVEELPVVGLVDLDVFGLEVLLEVLVPLEEDELVPVLWAKMEPEPAAQISKAPKAREAISFLTFTFIRSP